jgi:hypothetical protein
MNFSFFSNLLLPFDNGRTGTDDDEFLFKQGTRQSRSCSCSSLQTDFFSSMIDDFKQARIRC